MPIRVEFYGIARQRAGRSAILLNKSGAEATLGNILQELGQRLPEFGRECVAGGELQATLAANLDGQQFVTDPTTPVRDGQCLLILSADAGG